MAISTLNNKIIYTGNGSQTTFVYPFQYDVIGDIQVWVYGIGDIIGQRVYNFTASTASGNLTFTYPVSGDPLPAGHKLLLLRSTSLTQNIDLEEQSTVSLETLEKGYDKACLQLQDAQEKLTRAVIYSPVTEGEISGEELEADIVTTKATATQALALAQTVNSALPNKADLVDGKVPLYQLPETFEDVPSDNQSYVRKNKAWSNLTPDLNTINNRLNAAEGIGGYLQAYNFGVATPTATQLNDYALSQIQSISTPSEIFNGTRVKNTFNNNLWVLTNTPNTIPPVFEWTNNGLDTVSIATTATAGVVKASAATGEVAVAADGTTSVNGFNDKFDKIGGTITGNLIINRPTAAAISLVGAGAFQILEGKATSLSLYRGDRFDDRLTGILSYGKVKWYVYKEGVAKELGLTDASELSYSGPVSASTVKGAIDGVNTKIDNLDKSNINQRFCVSSGSWISSGSSAFVPDYVRKVDNSNAQLYASSLKPLAYTTAAGVKNAITTYYNFNITTPARKFVVAYAGGNITLSPAFSSGFGSIDNSFFPSYVAGSLSGGNTAKTGFSDSNFLVSRALFAPGPNAWEIGTKFTLSALGNNPIISSGGMGNESNYRLHVVVSDSELLFLVSGNGANWINVTTGSGAISANTPYWIKCKFDGSSTYTLSLSTDGVNYTNYTLNSSTTISRRATALVLGRSTFGNQYLRGTLDLTQTYFSYQGVRIAPAAEITDAIYYDTAIGKSYKYSGTAWVEFDCCVLGEILLKNSGSLVARAYPFNLDWNNLEDRGVIDSTALYYMPSTIEMPRAGKSITTISSINGATPYASDNMVNINDYVIFDSSLALICPFKNKLDTFGVDLYRN